MPISIARVAKGLEAPTSPTTSMMRPGRLLWSVETEMSGGLEALIFHMEDLNRNHKYGSVRAVDPFLET